VLKNVTLSVKHVAYLFAVILRILINLSFEVPIKSFIKTLYSCT